MVGIELQIFYPSLQNKNLQKTKIYHILLELNHLYLEFFGIFFSHSQYSPPVFTSPPAKTKTSIMSPLHSKIRQRPSKLALAWLGNQCVPRNMLEESQQIRVPLKPLLTRQVIQTNRSDLSFLGFPIILLCLFQPSMNSEILRGTRIYSRAARSTCRKRF